MCQSYGLRAGFCYGSKYFMAILWGVAAPSPAYKNGSHRKDTSRQMFSGTPANGRTFLSEREVLSFMRNISYSCAIGNGTGQSLEALDNIVVLHHMHGESGHWLQQAHERIKSPPVFFPKPGIEGKEGRIKIEAAELLDFLIEAVNLGSVKIVVLMPDPEIVIAGVINALSFKFHDEGDAHIRGADGADGYSGILQRIILVHAPAAAEDIVIDVHFLTIGSAQGDVTAKEIDGLRNALADVEDFCIVVIRVMVACKNPEPLSAWYGRQFALPIIKEQAVLLSFDIKATVAEIAYAHGFPSSFYYYIWIAREVQA